MTFMKCWSRATALLITLSGMAVLEAAEMGEVNVERLNVRGRPGFIGEVVTQLSRGEKVAVLDRVVLTDPDTREPQNWLKIGLPANTPVWIHARFVDEAAATVTASELNARSGAGENYSVLGRFQAGDPVSVISRKGDWLEVVQPNGAHAFVAEAMISLESGAFAGSNASEGVDSSDAASTPRAGESVALTTTIEPAPDPVEPINVEPVRDDAFETGLPVEAPPINGVGLTADAPAPVIADPDPMPLDLEEEIARNQPDLSPAKRALEERYKQSLFWEVGEIDESLLAEIPEYRREVLREGILKNSLSIQTPSPYVMANEETGLVQNYLYTTSGVIPLDGLIGRKVRVSGEEALDPRWKTPVLLIKTLKVIR